MEKGKLIVFEGGEGCGKTTMSNMVYDWMRENNIDCIKSREPGGTAIGNDIRNILLNREYSDNIDAFSELLLYEAARREHFIQIINPALKSGKHVILDRFILTTSVYQGGDRDDFDAYMMLINKLNNLAINYTKIDCTILLDIDPEISMRRIKDNNRETNRYDLASLEEQRKIRDLYKMKSMFYKNRYIIDADKSQDKIFNEVLKIIKGVIEYDK